MVPGGTGLEAPDHVVGGVLDREVHGYDRFQSNFISEPV
jgi:hypothetical protein